MCMGRLEELRRLMVQQLAYESAAVYQIGAAVAANSGSRVVAAVLWAFAFLPVPFQYCIF